MRRPTALLDEGRFPNDRDQSTLSKPLHQLRDDASGEPGGREREGQRTSFMRAYRVWNAAGSSSRASDCAGGNNCPTLPAAPWQTGLTGGGHWT